MNKSFLIIFLLYFIACDNEKIHSSWEISGTEELNPFFEHATNLKILDDSLIFYDFSSSKSYPVYISGNKMLINTETQKWIIEMQYHSDSVLILEELYAKNPFIIKLNKIQ